MSVSSSSLPSNSISHPFAPGGLFTVPQDTGFGYVSWLRHLGGNPLQRQSDFMVQELERTVCDGFMRIKILYAGNGLIPAYLLVPLRLSGRAPAVLLPHTHASNWREGKSEIVGLSASGKNAFAVDLVKQGFVVLAPDLAGFEERMQDGDLDPTGIKGFQKLMYSLILQGKTYLLLALQDLVAAVDVLESRPEVDSGRIGSFGFSFGGQLAAKLAVFDKRIRAVVAHCSVASVAGKLSQGTIIDPTEVIPHFVSLGDTVALLSEIAPSPFLISATSEDKYCADAQEVYEQLRQVWQECGHEDQIKFMHFNGGHEVTDEMKQGLYAWLGERLKLY